MTDLSDLVTVVMVTSPTASDPSLDAIQETYDSVRAFGALDGIRLYIGADGVRPEQRGLALEYEQKLRRLDSYLAVRRLGWWGHQANVLRMLLQRVETPLILFMEHDTPFTPDVEIDWQGCADTLLSGDLHSIRFLHESHVLPEYEHLFIDRQPQPGTAVPYLRTAQWSQRPHLANADWYRNLIDTYFARSSRTMIEDCLVGAANYQWRTYGEQGWNRFKLGVYADPEPTLQRSYHLDGRAGGEKYEMCYAYPGGTWPEGAPAPTLGRVFE